jgi:hypothetical protein
MICPVLYVFMEVMYMKRTQLFFHLFIGTSRDMGYPLKGSGSYSESERF